MISPTDIDILNELGHIPYSWGVFSLDNLSSKIKKKECGAINYDCMGTWDTWTSYFNDPKYSFI